MTAALVDPVRAALVAYARGAGCCRGCAYQFGMVTPTAAVTLLEALEAAERDARACVGAGHHGNGGPS